MFNGFLEGFRKFSKTWIVNKHVPIQQHFKNLRNLKVQKFKQNSASIRNILEFFGKFLCELKPLRGGNFYENKLIW